MNKRQFHIAILGVAMLVACGGSTTADRDGGGTATDAARPDARGEDGATPVDAGPPGCASDVECNDDVDCTRDTCSAATGACRHQVVPALCPAGSSCHPIRGCEAGRPCATSVDCQDEDACTVNERCDPAARTCVVDPLDGDGDGDPPRVCGGTDCDDSRSEVFAGAPEQCNGIDDDCDGSIDEEPATLTTCGPGSFVCRDQVCVCTADTASDPLNCGGCNNACDGGASCVGGSCSCSVGMTYCPGMGCTTIGSDSGNCGFCGNACGVGDVCILATCCENRGAEVCNGNDDDCDGVVDNGFPCALGSRVSCTVSCGGEPETGTTMAACESDCSLPRSCPGSWDGFTGEIYGGAICGGCCSDACAHCHDSWDGDCDGLIDCADPDCRGEMVADPRCCGIPGSPCCTSGGFDFCTTGTCMAGTCECPAGTTLCDGACVDTGTDAANCGACGIRCTATGSVCAGGACGCPSTASTLCSGTCTDTNSDSLNCGACGNPCGASTMCVGGACVSVSGCADGASEQIYGSNMVGCNGSANLCAAAALCGSGWHLCTPDEHASRTVFARPTSGRWLAACLRDRGGATCSSRECTDCSPGTGLTVSIEGYCDTTVAAFTSDLNVGIYTYAYPSRPARRPGFCAPCMIAAARPASTAGGAVCCL